jgi:hypothetical protein
MQLASVHGVITDAAPYAIHYIKHVALGKVKRPSPVRLAECHYLVDQCIGKATQRVEHKAPPSSPLSWGDLLKSAEEKRVTEERRETSDLVEVAQDIVSAKVEEASPVEQPPLNEPGPGLTS